MLDFQRLNFNPQVGVFFPLVMMDERNGSPKTETEQTVLCSQCADTLIGSCGARMRHNSKHIHKASNG